MIYYHQQKVDKLKNQMLTIKTWDLSKFFDQEIV